MVSGPVLVTGATGGLGRVLVAELLATGREVVATGRNPDIGTALQAGGARFIRADLTGDDLNKLCENAGTVFHLAALSAPWGPHAAFIAANVMATQRLLETARRQGCSRFIFASTPSIYTAARHQLQLDENSPLPRRYANSYAATKHAAERAVLAAAHEGFSTLALRPRAVIRPYDTVLLPRLLRAAKRGVMPLPGWGKALIEPTDARDAARAALHWEHRPKPS
ncbi:MAG: NAD(P)-dependent oxidoreductase, partial [Pseudomonadales bacterium]|nr:NAD(P)-dependent oxidoreductase [Pseudomonadales bacterium]